MNSKIVLTWLFFLVSISSSTANLSGLTAKGGGSDLPTVTLDITPEMTYTMIELWEKTQNDIEDARDQIAKKKREATNLKKIIDYLSKGNSEYKKHWARVRAGLKLRSPRKRHVDSELTVTQGLRKAIQPNSPLGLALPQTQIPPNKRNENKSLNPESLSQEDRVMPVEDDVFSPRTGFSGADSSYGGLLKHEDSQLKRLESAEEDARKRMFEANKQYQLVKKTGSGKKLEKIAAHARIASTQHDTAMQALEAYTDRHAYQDG